MFPYRRKSNTWAIEIDRAYCAGYDDIGLRVRNAIKADLAEGYIREDAALREDL